MWVLYMDCDMAQLFPSLDRRLLRMHEIAAGVPSDVLDPAASIYGRGIRHRRYPLQVMLQVRLRGRAGRYILRHCRRPHGECLVDRQSKILRPIGRRRHLDESQGPEALGWHANHSWRSLGYGRFKPGRKGDEADRWPAEVITVRRPVRRIGTQLDVRLNTEYTEY